MTNYKFFILVNDVREGLNFIQEILTDDFYTGKNQAIDKGVELAQKGHVVTLQRFEYDEKRFIYKMEKEAKITPEMV